MRRHLASAFSLEDARRHISLDQYFLGFRQKCHATGFYALAAGGLPAPRRAMLREGVRSTGSWRRSREMHFILAEAYFHDVDMLIISRSKEYDESRWLR